MVRNTTAWAVVALTITMLFVGAGYSGGGGAAGPAAEVNGSEIAAAVHAETNAARAAAGRPRLRHAAGLQTTAADHSAWMADTTQLEHSDRGTYACESAGENIAYTYASEPIRVNETKTVDLRGNETRIGQRLVANWLDSPAHRENLLDREYQRIGVGIHVEEIDGRQRVYATQALCGT